MPDLGLKISNMNPEERQALYERAAQALRDHQCIVLPTDTLYGLVTQADQAGAALLDEITGHPETTDQPKMTLHLADAEQIIEHLVLEAATTRRLIDRLLPGPVRLLIEQPDNAISTICTALNIERGLIDNGSHIALRIPDHPVFRQILRSSGVACVARRLAAAAWAKGEDPGTDLSSIPDNTPNNSAPFPAPFPTLVIDDGPTLHKQHSTTISLSMDGRIKVSKEGVLNERDILTHLERTILFVCTGNTCRSPMAQAIAKDLIDQQEPQGITTHITSAGVAAGEGIPATNEAISVLHKMGIELSGHQSKLLTLPMIDNAEIIYTMTPSHAQAVMTMAPNSVHKVFVLDEHQGVPDPIGQGTDVYQHTARRLSELIARRLEEIRI